ncbi:MAG: ABC transporter permease [Vicinamibacterales bacterium]|nr:ABC transporter permease [Vicinamibacterales bacterium]
MDRPEELVDLFPTTPDEAYAPLSYPTVEDLQDGTVGVFSGFAESTFLPVQIDSEKGVEGVFVEVVTGDSFPTIDVEALLGRVIRPSDDVEPGGHPVVMLNYGYWQRRFAGDPDIVGRELRVNGRAYTIIGVAPVDYPGSARWLEMALYVPASMVDELAGFNVRDDRRYAQTGPGWFGKARLAAVDPAFFDTRGIPMALGRSFRDADGPIDMSSSTPPLGAPGETAASRNAPLPTCGRSGSYSSSVDQASLRSCSWLRWVWQGLNEEKV